MKILIAHSGLQHCHQLARALYEAKYDILVVTGIPLLTEPDRLRGWGRLRANLFTTPIPRSRRHHPIVFPLMRKAVSLYAPKQLASSLFHAIERIFDVYTCLVLVIYRPKAVICYENCASLSFAVAKMMGTHCVLDAASIHPECAERWLADVDESDPGWVQKNKRAEIKKADVILTCSPFAAETFRVGGVNTDKIRVISLGASSKQKGESLVKRLQRHESTMRFVCVGSVIKRKGIDLLAKVFTSLYRKGVPADLTLIGGAPDKDLLREVLKSPNVRHVEFMSHARLSDELASFDCMILFSRFDSFGMVVPEGLAAGLPVVLSERVGAKCIIEKYPDAGWILPVDAGAAERLLERLASDRGDIERRRSAALSAVAEFSWESYRRQAVAQIEEALNKLEVPRLDNSSTVKQSVK